MLKFMQVAVIRAADHGRGITVGEFEQGNFAGDSRGLDRADTERVRPALRPNASAAPVRLCRKARL
jgi:hypothetical protein